MQKIHRSYGDNGQLKKVTIDKGAHIYEMDTRGVRYYKKTKKDAFINDLKALVFTFTAMLVLVTWYLINN